jgi:hypothetical protein
MGKNKKYLNKMHSDFKSTTSRKHQRKLSLKSTTSINKTLADPSFRLINKKRMSN